MTAWLIALALVSLVVIAVSEEFSWVPTSFSSYRVASATTHRRVFRQSLFASHFASSRSIVPMQFQNSMADQLAETPRWAKPGLSLRFAQIFSIFGGGAEASSKLRVLLSRP